MRSALPLDAEITALHARLDAWARSSATVHAVPLVQHEPLGTEVIDELLRRFGAQLPAAYSEHLAVVGNGGLGPTHYPLLTLAQALDASPRVDERFGLEAPFAKTSQLSLTRAHDELVRHGALDLDALGPEPRDIDETAGCLRVGHSGGGLDFHLVCDPFSDRYGEIWLSCDAGVAPVARDFERWFDAAVDGFRARAKTLEAQDPAGWPPDAPSIAADACEIIDGWVERVQSWTARDLMTERQWTRSEAVESRAAALTGRGLRWEREHVRRVIDRAAELLGPYDDLLLARAWSEVLLGVGAPEQSLDWLSDASAEVGFLRAEVAGARGDLDAAIGIARATAAEHPRSLTTQNALATYLLRQGELDEAEVIVDRLLERGDVEWEPALAATRSERPQDVAYAMLSKVMIMVAREDVASAFTWLDRALEAGLPRWVVALCSEIDGLKKKSEYRALMRRHGD